MITTNSRIEGKKLSELILPPQLRTKGILKTRGTMETFLCVQDAPCITQEFAQSSVRLATRVMSSPNHPTSGIEDAFSSNFPDYIPISLDYVPASPGNTYSSSSNNSFGLVPITSPTLSLFHDDPYMKVMLKNHLFHRQLLMPPKRTSTFETPAMTQAAIKKLVFDSVSVALETQAANMANTDNTTRPREAPVARKCSYKEFISCQPFSFKGTEGAVGLIRWFKKTKSLFSRSNCTEDCKVKFATRTLIEEALSWWNSFSQPIGIEEAYKITWVEFKKLLIKKYCPRTEIQKMEDEF
ncbi:hypothetical protein Tco_1328430 [Tanacetum coccineum]